MPRHARPRTLMEATALIAERPWRLLAGGTDFYPAQGSRPIREDVLDLGALDDLRGIEATQTHLVIGARTTWTDLLRADLPPAFAALGEAAREVGSVQIQNAATLAGNLCNASPAADGVPPLLVLDCEVELASAGGRRVLPLGDFILGNRRTAMRPDELMVALRVPKSSTSGASAFIKLGARRYLVISIAMVAARLRLDARGAIREVAVAVGACSPVAMRLRRLEASLIGCPTDGGIRAAIADVALDELSPIDDVRASAAYRRHAAREIVARALEEAGRRAAASGTDAGRTAA